MTSFDQLKSPVRPKGKGGAFLIAAATGIDDPLASEAGRALMKLFYDRTGEGRLATRRDFSPADLKPYLTNITIMDVLYNDAGLVCDGIVRVMGSDLEAYYGHLTGRHISEHPTDTGERFVASAQAAVDAKGPSVGHSTQSVPDRERFSVKTCWIPIADNKGEITQILGHIQLFDKAGRPLPAL